MSLQLSKFYKGFIHLARPISLSATALVVSSQVVAQPITPATAIASLPSSSLKQTPGEPTPSVPPVSGTTRFGCQVLEGQYTVVYYPESQPNQAYPWAVPTAMGGGWTPDLRCAEISRRLEFYRPDGLQELQTSVENGYNIVCATTERNPDCRIVFTVPPGQDPVATRDRVFENLTVADSGQRTDGVTTFTGADGDRLLDQLGNVLDLDLSSLSGRRQARSNGINLRPFLDRNDGGTGTQLQDGIPVQSRSRRN